MQLLKSWLNRASVWFTALALATLLFGLLFLPEQSQVSPRSFLLLFPFSLSASAAGLFWKRTSLPAVPKFLLHYIILLASSFLFIILPSGVPLSAPFLIVTAILFTVFWWISRGLVHLLANKSAQKEK